MPARQAALIVALVCAGCRHQPNFSIPICDSSLGGCTCQLTGWIVCDSVCVDPMLDRDNCGGCGASCGGQVCAGGACADGCGDLGQCGGACTDDEDPYNCGACGNVCEGGCVAGACGATAAECHAKMLTACDGVCVDLDHDPRNCGACGNDRCPNGCDFGHCCDGKICDGLCAHVFIDPNNCGDCHVRCSQLRPNCDNGQCVP